MSQLINWSIDKWVEIVRSRRFVISEQGGWQSIEDFGMFGETERLADEIWKVVVAWNSLAQDTIGKQLIRAADSVGANLVEGDGRYHHKEKLNFYYIARASAKETRYWIRRAQSRCLLASEQVNSFLSRLESVLRWINTLITQRRRWIAELREESEDYIV